MSKRGIILIACLILVPFVTFAQGEPGWGKMTLGANFELNLPVGDFGNVAGTGYGGNLRFQYGADSRSAFTATAGYLVWGKKDYAGGISGQAKAFNIFLGGKYYFAPGFYGSLEGGLYFTTFDYSGIVVGASGNATRFMLPIGLGFQKSGFEIGARYMLYHPDLNNFSITLGYNFAL